MQYYPSPQNPSPCGEGLRYSRTTVQQYKCATQQKLNCTTAAWPTNKQRQVIIRYLKACLIYLLPSVQSSKSDKSTVHFQIFKLPNFQIVLVHFQIFKLPNFQIVLCL
jgi:hypothetical protein